MDDYDAYDAILHHLFKLTQGDAWFKPAQDSIAGGVCLRVDRGIHFRVFPYENFALVPFEQAVRGLNPVVAIKLRSAAVHSALGNVEDDATAIHIDGNTRIQILETMLALPMADKEQCAAFIRDERVMIIWSDDLDSIIPIFQDFEAKLIKLVYSSRASTLLATPAASASILAADDTASNVNLTTEKPEQAEVNKKAEQAMKERQEGRKKGGRSKFSRWFSWKLEEPSKEGEGGDPEKGEVKKQKRSIRLFAPIYGGMGAALSTAERALEMALEEVFEESGKNHKGWGGNARSLRIGELILICDADTIVPEDCFRDAARALVECPEVAIIQHESDVMQVSFDFFENGIARFTRRINRAISMACANGEVAPFVGHNAFLRWSAIQDAAFIDEADGKKKMWSESNVSEDFDMALRLQLRGYIIRWSSYSQGGFKEGVSLTVDDELNRWQKYSYGCNELLFNPLIQWWRKGPLTKHLRIFIWSDAPVHYKISMMAYMFSYYGIAASAMLSLLNYLILGFELDIDGCYIHSFEIFLACTVVFPGAGNVAFTLLEYRLGQRGLIEAAIENLTWVPFFFFFFGGLSVHLSTALLAHVFSYNITWGATKKEVERSNFFIEVPKIWKRFWMVLCLCTAIAAGMVVLSLESVVDP
ncbi:glycosyl transferase family group 2-domain-containing protein [Pterulicium gracile]|uniref:Glycosyl transferase family group 2-domain-containing protein n=1 Tax=Pterulicium gracile TaxID=1884261 RepID=A0A5C3Q027_9AGAR|nr:glycosyl transferase family group 2-domain-containing protein [Pterula gracilis]